MLLLACFSCLPFVIAAACIFAVLVFRCSLPWVPAGNCRLGLSSVMALGACSYVVGVFGCRAFLSFGGRFLSIFRDFRFRTGCGFLCCLRKVPDELVKLKKHMAMMHGMQTLTAVMPSESDLAQKYALSK